MQALWAILIKLGLAVLSALPVERVLALLLNKLLDKVSPANIGRAQKTAQHLAELSALFNDIVADRAVTVEEATQIRDEIVRARERLLAAWSVGADAKSTQTELGKTGLVAEYAETASAN